jgi:hypothetical protein
MFNVSGWVRAMFRDAALAGVQDAMQVITPEGETAPADLGELRQRLAASVHPVKALSAVKADAEEPVAAGEPDTAPASGKRKK